MGYFFGAAPIGSQREGDNVSKREQDGAGRSVTNVHEEWFANEEKVRKTVGLLENLDNKTPKAGEASKAQPNHVYYECSSCSPFSSPARTKS
ncbi:Zinc finger, C6HC-type [Artemisia annua]|uniref:Zinc finger, C6HC-type n=1 Tax=Artemisia annua TaxID=35608 RepID=A0A2U1N0I4_ARTAN|nr:Zinc finger, C6HC-type [Artemisia annua]